MTDMYTTVNYYLSSHPRMKVWLHVWLLISPLTSARLTDETRTDLKDDAVLPHCGYAMS